MPDKKLRLQIYKFMRTCLVNLYWIDKTQNRKVVFGKYIIELVETCFCSGLRSFLLSKGMHPKYFNIEDLSELIAYKPLEVYGLVNVFWYPIDSLGIRKRINILDNIITNLEKELI